MEPYGTVAPEAATQSFWARNCPPRYNQSWLPRRPREILRQSYMEQPQSPQYQAERPTLAVTARRLQLKRPLQEVTPCARSRPRHSFPRHDGIQEDCLQK